MRVTITCLLLFCSVVLFGQKAVNVAIGEGTVLRAMEDEMQRGMDKLKLPGYEKPLYIHYQIDQRTAYHLSASFGALAYENEYSNLSIGNYRVLCGTYDFNDESLNHQTPSGMRMNFTALPTDTSDYMGIRRTLWNTIESTYRGAALGLAKNEEMAKQKGLTHDKISHRSFAKVSAVSMLLNFDPETPNKPNLQLIVRRFSDSLAGFKGVNDSDVHFSYSRGYSYTVSSEGQRARVPNSLSSISLRADCRDADGNVVQQQINLYASTPGKLMDEKWLNGQLDTLKKVVALAQKTKSIEEPYDGPVLFLGEAVARVFSGAVLGYEDQLSYDNDIEDEYGRNFRRNDRSAEKKVGTIMTNEAITVNLEPNLRNFNGVELLGRYEFDREGTVPAPLTLIESGMLKGLMNDRTITSADQPANGYAGQAGVVHVIMKNGVTAKVLRDRLVAEARKEGLAYGLVFQFLPGGTSVTYKVYVNDGHEEMVQADMPMVSLRSLKKVLGSSTRYTAYNIMPFMPGVNARMMRMSGMEGGGRMGGGLTSFIVPDALLVGGLELESEGRNGMREKKEEFVAKPE